MFKTNFTGHNKIWRALAPNTGLEPNVADYITHPY